MWIFRILKKNYKEEGVVTSYALQIGMFIHVHIHTHTHTNPPKTFPIFVNERENP